METETGPDGMMMTGREEKMTRKEEKKIRREEMMLCRMMIRRIKKEVRDAS